MSDDKDARLKALVLMLFRLRTEDHRDHTHCLLSGCVIKQCDELLDAEASKQRESM